MSCPKCLSVEVTQHKHPPAIVEAGEYQEATQSYEIEAEAYGFKCEKCGLDFGVDAWD